MESLVLGCRITDRILPLALGSVRPRNIELRVVGLDPYEVIRKQGDRAFHLSEFSLLSYAQLVATGDDQFVGLPVFLARRFRHGSIYVNRGLQIGTPQALQGRHVGASNYVTTAGVWIRGTLKDDYGLAPSDVEWHLGGMNAPARFQDRDHLPTGFRFNYIEPPDYLDAALRRGDIAAVIDPIAPSVVLDLPHQYGRLFEAHDEVEREFFSRTGIFPIMHLAVLQRAVYEANPWLLQSLIEAFELAKAAAYRQLFEPGALVCSLPWLAEHASEVTALMGSDPFAYGLSKNAPILNVFLRYAWEEGLIDRRLRAADLFPEAASWT